MKRFDDVVPPQVAGQAPFHPAPYRGFEPHWSLVSEEHISSCASGSLASLRLLLFCAHCHSGPTELAWAVLTLARAYKFLWLPKSLPVHGEQPDDPRTIASVLLLNTEPFPGAH